MEIEALDLDFFDRDPSVVAVELLGALVHHKYNGVWLTARIIETESYYLVDKGSHASLGRTHKRRALFMDAGTVYMYYARGGDSLNVSCRGEGNAVLIKAAVPAPENQRALEIMKELNPRRDGGPRNLKRLCSGQTLLCRSLGLKVPDYDGLRLPLKTLRFTPSEIREDAFIQTTRLGIPAGRDEDLWQRFILLSQAASATKNPLTSRKRIQHYWVSPSVCLSRRKEYILFDHTVEGREMDQ